MKKFGQGYEMASKIDCKIIFESSVTPITKFMDGVGPTLKIHAMKKIITRKYIINNAEQFCNAVKYKAVKQ